MAVSGVGSALAALKKTAAPFAPGFWQKGTAGFRQGPSPVFEPESLSRRRKFYMGR